MSIDMLDGEPDGMEDMPEEGEAPRYCALCSMLLHEDEPVVCDACAYSNDEEVSW